MRNRLVRSMLTVLLAFTLSGCAMLYNDLKTPLPTLSTATRGEGTEHVGKASCSWYVWCVAVGDCSVQAAMKNGGISKVHHVDSEITSYFFGIYSRFTTVVYGD